MLKSWGRRQEKLDKFVVIDLETTGHSPAVDDQIIEIGIVVIENNQISEEFTTLLKRVLIIAMWKMRHILKI